MSSDEPPVSRADRAHFNLQARHLAAFSIQLHLLQGPPITRRQLDAASRLLTRRELCDVMNERAAAGLCGNPQCTRTVDVTLRMNFGVTAGSSKFCSRGCEERGRAAVLCFPWKQRGGGDGWGECWSRDDLTVIVTAVTTPDGDGACAGSVAAAASISGLAGSGLAVSGSAGSGSAAMGSAGPQCVSEGSRSGTGGEAAPVLSARLQSAAARLWTAGMAGASGVAGASGIGEKGGGGGGGGGRTGAGGFLGLVLMGGAGGDEEMAMIRGMEGCEDGGEERQRGHAEGLRGVRGIREGERGLWTSSTLAAPLEGTRPAPACKHPQELESRQLFPASNGFNWACRGATEASQGIAAVGSGVVSSGRGGNSGCGGSSSCGGSGGAPATSTAACGACSCGSGQEPCVGSGSRGTREGRSACGGPHATSTETGSASAPWVNGRSSCASQQRPGEGSREASQCSGGVSAAFWEALLWERGGVEQRDASSSGNERGDSEESARLERRREGQGEEDQECVEMAEQAEGEAEEKSGEDGGGREDGFCVEEVGGEGVWQRLMAHQVRQAACKAHVLSTPLPLRTSHPRMPHPPLSPSVHPPSSFSSSSSSFSSLSSSSPCLYPPYRSASLPLTSSSSSRSPRSFSSSVSSSSSSPCLYPPYRSASLPLASTSSSPFHSFRSSHSSSSASLHVHSSSTPTQPFNQTHVPTTSSRCPSAPTPIAFLSPASSALSRLPSHSNHEPTTPRSPLPSAPSWPGFLRPALRTSPRYQQGRAGQPMGLPRSVSWADAQGKALTEELRFSARDGQ